MSFLNKKYPKVHRIDDWENPWLPLPIRLLNKTPDTLMKHLVPLDEESLLTRAKNKTGLNDFGSDDFLEPFRLLLADLNRYDHFTPMGRITARVILHQQLCARLCLEHRVKQQSSITDIKIDRPLIIAGLPRTGTTHLHNLLSRISTVRYLPLWQTLHPAAPLSGKKDTRKQVADLSVQATHYIIPLFERMHEMTTNEPHEELTLCALCYRSFFFEGAFQVPNYRKWYAENEHTQGYAYLKKVLQILQTEKASGNKTADARWVLKSPQHVDQLETLLKIFPDAKIILTHRDPARAILSMITMMLYASRQVYKPTRLKEEALAWVERLEQMLSKSRQQAQHLNSDQLLWVDFDAFMADPLHVIKQIETFADIEIDAQSQQAIQNHLNSHARDRHGRIDYNFEDLGLHEGDIKKRLSLYAH